MGTDIEEIEARVRVFLGTEYRADELYRLGPIVSQLGTISRFTYHDKKYNPFARSAGVREEEVIGFGELMIHVVAMCLARGIKIGDAIEAGFERLQDKDGYEREGKALETDENGETVLKGEFGSPGVAQGTALVMPSVSKAGIKKLSDVMAKERCVLVTGTLNPDSFSGLGKIHLIAIITDQGGRTSHAVILARNLGIPCVPGTLVATEKIESGDFVLVDGDRKEVIFRHREGKE